MSKLPPISHNYQENYLELSIVWKVRCYKETTVFIWAISISIVVNYLLKLHLYKVMESDISQNNNRNRN